MRILSLFLIAAFTIVGCEKNVEMGEVLFCTNSGIINCPFSIELSIDNRIVDTLSAVSEYVSNDCSCAESHFLGVLMTLGSGEHNYYAKELNCQGNNRVNEWSGIIILEDNSCGIVVLDIQNEP